MRRHALGVLRMLIERDLPLTVKGLVAEAFAAFPAAPAAAARAFRDERRPLADPACESLGMSWTTGMSMVSRSTSPSAWTALDPLTPAGGRWPVAPVLAAAPFCPGARLTKSFGRMTVSGSVSFSASGQAGALAPE